MKLQKLYSHTRKAIELYDMIQENDKIAIGISGGKDSLTLLYALAGLREFYPKKFEIIAISVNPGFDFFTANLSDVIIFGEAKYLATKNAYGSGMSQTARFIEEKRDISDIADIQNFFSDSALSGVYDGTKGFSVAFSAKSIFSETLIQNIKKNAHYKNLASYSELIFVAVNI